jgi:hypothetical protein
MESSGRARILVVANQTPATPRLLQAIRHRAGVGPCVFCLLVPALPGRKVVDWTSETAVRLIERESRSPVHVVAGGETDAFAGVQRAVEAGRYDEIIVSTMPQRSTWRRRDLVSRIEGLGVPVTAVMPRQIPTIEAIENSEEVWRSF